MPAGRPVCAVVEKIYGSYVAERRSPLKSTGTKTSYEHRKKKKIVRAFIFFKHFYYYRYYAVDQHEVFHARLLFHVMYKTQITHKKKPSCALTTTPHDDAYEWYKLYASNCSIFFPKRLLFRTYKSIFRYVSLFVFVVRISLSSHYGRTTEYINRLLVWEQRTRETVSKKTSLWF